MILRYALIWVVLVYFINFFCLGFLIGPFDYDHLSAYYELAWRYWHVHGLALPHYNPFLCGGRSLAGDPQIPLFHPAVLFVPIFGAAATLKWEMCTQLILGWIGLNKMTADLKVGKEGRRWATLLFLAGGSLVARFMVGHVTLGFYFLSPLFFALSYRLQERPSHQLRVAYVALFAYAGLYKPNFLIYAVPPLLVESAARAYLSRQPRVLVETLFALVCGTIVDMVSILPAWRYFHDFPRSEGSSVSYVPLYTFIANLLMPIRTIPKSWYGPGFLQRHEYNLFLGPVAVWMAWRGFRLVREETSLARSRWMALVIFGLFSILTGVGVPPAETFGPLQTFLPAFWLRKFWPGFSSIRCPPRFWAGASLAILVFSARGFRPFIGRYARLGFILVGVLPLVGQATVNLSKASLAPVGIQSSPPAQYPSEILHTEGPFDRSYREIRVGHGVINCVENMEVYRAPEIHAGNALDIAEANGSAEWVDWHRIRVKGSGARLSFNLNHSDYWRAATNGARIVSTRGQPLAIQLASTEGEIVFEQPLTREAALVSLTGLVLFCFWAIAGAVLARRRQSFSSGQSMVTR